MHPTSNESILFDLKVSISGDNQYHAANTSAQLRPGETRILSFEIGAWRKGNKCQLTLVGKGKDTTIRNKADLEFEPKSCSIFIQTDKAIYKPGQTILFRLILVNSALLPVSNGTFELYVLVSLLFLYSHFKLFNFERTFFGQVLVQILYRIRTFFVVETLDNNILVKPLDLLKYFF